MAKSKKAAKSQKISKAATQAADRAATKAREIRSKLEATFERTLERTIETARERINSPQITRARDSAMAAKKTIDETLLDLQHRALELRNDPQDVIQKIGHRVLERAEAVRAQLADQRYSPSWLKDITLTPKSDVAPAGEEGELEESLEDSAEERAAGSIVEADVATAHVGSKRKTPRASKSGGKRVTPDTAAKTPVH